MYKTLYSRRYRALLGALVEVRRQRGITQVDLAKRLRQEQSWVSKCERGARRIDVIELALWCDALGVSLPQFLKAHAAVWASAPR